MENKFKQFFYSLTQKQQQQLLELLTRIDLATNINPDEEFLKEALQPLFTQYPYIKDLMEGVI